MAPTASPREGRDTSLSRRPSDSRSESANEAGSASSPSAAQESPLHPRTLPPGARAVDESGAASSSSGAQDSPLHPRTLPPGARPIDDAGAAGANTTTQELPAIRRAASTAAGAASGAEAAGAQETETGEATPATRDAAVDRQQDAMAMTPWLVGKRAKAMKSAVEDILHRSSSWSSSDQAKLQESRVAGDITNPLWKPMEALMGQCKELADEAPGNDGRTFGATAERRVTQVADAHFTRAIGRLKDKDKQRLHDQLLAGEKFGPFAPFREQHRLMQKHEAMLPGLANTSDQLDFLKQRNQVNEWLLRSLLRASEAAMQPKPAAVASGPLPSPSPAQHQPLQLHDEDDTHLTQSTA